MIAYTVTDHFMGMSAKYEISNKPTVLLTTALGDIELDCKARIDKTDRIIDERLILELPNGNEIDLALATLIDTQDFIRLNRLAELEHDTKHTINLDSFLVEDILIDITAMEVRLRYTILITKYCDKPYRRFCSGSITKIRHIDTNKRQNVYSAGNVYTSGAHVAW